VIDIRSYLKQNAVHGVKKLAMRVISRSLGGEMR